jgi:quinol monooxygenase YgiN
MVETGRGIGGIRYFSPASSNCFKDIIMIHVLAILTALPGKRAEVLQAFQANVPAVHAENGCIEYTAVVDVDGADPAFGPDTFVVVEKWASMDALKAHAAAAHMAAYGEKVKHLMAARAVHVLNPA